MGTNKTKLCGVFSVLLWLGACTQEHDTLPAFLIDTEGDIVLQSIAGNEDSVAGYLDCVEGIDKDNALAVVVLNCHDYAGTTYFYGGTEFAIACCPVIDSLASENFRQVLTHEAVGHGFAKLWDEYGYQEYGRIPDHEARTIQYWQTEFGWAANVDFTDDWEEVRWAEFLGNNRYAAEGLGVFEGTCTYWRGAYRPTEESMMNSNQSGFNAPSRQAIYNKVMEMGEGREASYEDFAAFDLQPTAALRRKRGGSPASALAHPRLATPVVKGVPPF